ncbi:AAA family ATPase [Tumebacillus flagellatus]|uniref:Nuclease SbcCD subunit C n=1 Tax=Tumebacillus flagellatus TaxID=1157490 RepID=A0A074MAS3_9BACL|nr:SMC family ATPase [Tumebacillus flagellatus]KEO83017.1 hypothetical protein EL26_12060 [Tumebacillus flagellatus]
MRLQAIEIEAFRGFGETFSFSFQDADVLVLYGPNGHGKTSFFDAIEWALTGKLFRYEEEETQERKQYRYVGNKFHQARNPRVRLEAGMEDGQVVVLTRTGTAKPTDTTDAEKSSLVLTVDEVSYTGEEAEVQLRDLLVHRGWQEVMTDVGKGLFLTHLLSQERMNRFLRGMKESERYENVSMVFGTEPYNNRYRNLFQEAKKVMERRLGDLEAQKQSLLAEHRALQPQLAELASLVADVLPEQSQLSAVEDLSVERIHEERRALQQEQEKLQGVQVKLTRARQAYNEWQERKPVYEANLQELKRYQSLEELDTRLRKLEWLQQRVPEYEKNGNRQAELVQNRAIREQSVQDLREEQATAEHVFNLLKKAGLSPEPAARIEWLAHLRRTVVDDLRAESAWAPWKRFAALVQSMEQAAMQSIQLQRLRKQAHCGREDAQSALTAYRSVQEQYNRLLISLRDHVNGHQDLQACPACGTSGITAAHILAHVQHQQEQVDPQLMQFQERLDQAAHRLQTVQAEWEAAEAFFQTQYGQFAKELESWQAQLLQSQSEMKRQQQTANLEQAELSELEQSLADFQHRAQSLGLQATGADLGEEIQQQLRQTRQQWVDLAAEERNTWRESCESCKQTVLQAKEIRHALKESLQALALHPKEAEAASLLLEGAEQEYQARQTDLISRMIQVDSLLHQLETVSALRRYRQLLQQEQALQARLQAVESRVGELTERIEVVKSVRNKVPEAVAKMNNEVMEGLFSTMRSIFLKLNSHPLFCELDHDTVKKRNLNHLFLTVLTGEQSGELVEANPSYIFSSAQVNAVALSFFLAMALQQQWSPLQLIALDDPVQSMDDLNVLALIDLIRNLLQDPSNTRRQFIISTHDSSFYEWMLKKFRFLRVGFIEYESYSEKGPQTYRDVVPPLHSDFDIRTAAWKS